MVALRIDQIRPQFKTGEEAAMEAYAQTIDDMTLGAREDRALEFINELPPAQAERVRERWYSMLRCAASVQEARRDD